VAKINSKPTSFRLKVKTKKQLESLADHYESSMTSVIEMLVNDNFKLKGLKVKNEDK
jgi:predicted DNA-binding protein